MKPFTYHNHTVFCDGKSTVDQMVISAIAHGCDAIGFSAHSYTPFDSYYCMPVESIAEYRRTVRACSKKYGDKINVLLGIEQDVESDATLYTDEYDFKIGSAHSIYKNGSFYSVDASREQLEKMINELYGGDPYALCEDYFEELVKVTEMKDCQIVGHIDLVTKFNEGGALFDESDPRYVAAAERTIKALAQEGLIFEINTGAMARGYRTSPYPARHLLRIIKREGGRVTYSSDCHAAENILCGYDEARSIAKECGFEGFMKLTDGEWKISYFDN